MCASPYHVGELHLRGGANGGLREREGGGGEGVPRRQSHTSPLSLLGGREQTGKKDNVFSFATPSTPAREERLRGGRGAHAAGEVCAGRFKLTCSTRVMSLLDLPIAGGV